MSNTCSNCGCVLECPICDPGNEDLVNDIDRLQQQVDILRKAYELLRTATFGAHSAHFDPTHGSGSGCPECIRMREIRAEADNLSKKG